MGVFLILEASQPRGTTYRDAPEFPSMSDTRQAP